MALYLLRISCRCVLLLVHAFDWRECRRPIKRQGLCCKELLVRQDQSACAQQQEDDQLERMPLILEPFAAKDGKNVWREREAPRLPKAVPRTEQELAQHQHERQAADEKDQVFVKHDEGLGKDE